MTLLDQQLEQGRIYARLDVYRRKLDYALAGIAAMRELAPHAYLSLSFGKQSSVVAHMLYQIEPEIPMYFLAGGESFIIHNYAEVIADFTARWPINLSIVRRDHVFDGQALSWEENLVAGNGELASMCDRTEWDGWYWGLTKDEGRARSITLSKRWPGQPHPTIFRYQDNKYRCCPLANWRLLDLAAYIATYDIPMLAQYVRFGLETRTTARIRRRATGAGAVWEVKQTDMSAFNQLCARFPELRARS